MYNGLADKKKEVQLLRDQLLGVNDPFELLAEVIADNNRLRRIIDTCDCNKGKP
tara:strand:+ start:17 stop:178 length:162 start_codon:yes stop_codon:yes gene_type:complete